MSYLTVTCSNEEYNKWKNGKILYWGKQNKFATRRDIIKELKSSNKYPQYKNRNWNSRNELCTIFDDEGIESYNDFFNDEWCTIFSEEHISPSGETIIVFGRYVCDGQNY